MVVLVAGKNPPLEKFYAMANDYNTGVKHKPYYQEVLGLKDEDSFFFFHLSVVKSLTGTFWRQSTTHFPERMFAYIYSLG